MEGLIGMHTATTFLESLPRRPDELVSVRDLDARFAVFEARMERRSSGVQRNLFLGLGTLHAAIAGLVIAFAG